MSEESEGQVNEGGEGEVTPSYFFADGVGGQGETPEWFDNAKYKTVSDQAKAYPELAKKFGSFVGAPESYSVNAPEGFKVEDGDPVMASAMEWAKEQNMSQKGFDSLVGMYAEIEAGKEKALEDFANEQRAQIENYDSRETNINNFLKANDLGALAGMITNKEEMEQFEKLMDMTGKASLGEGGEGVSVPTQEEVDKLMFEKDEHGRQIYGYDKERQERVRKMIEARVGKGEHRKVIG